MAIIFHRRNAPETRWRLATICGRLGLSLGLRIFIQRQVSYWIHRLWFRYWTSEKHYPNQEWKEGNIVLFRRTAWYQRNP